MEVQQVVVLAENGDLKLANLSRHVLFHATLSLLPQQSTHKLLPRSGSRKIENFCSELPQAIVAKATRKKNSVSEAAVGSVQFVPSIEIHKFLERTTTVSDFTLVLERKLLELSRGEIDPDILHGICWSFYEMEKNAEISFPQWLSRSCAYRLWMVFCCVQEQALDDKLSAMTANKVIKRLVDLCGYPWNESYRYDETEFLDFPQYLRAISGYFTRLGLEMSVTCEVIVDMVDEIVHGVIRKGYLMKKGHTRKNMKKRWFVLQRNIMKYFDSRESMSLKGQLILNSKTTVKGVPDKGKKKYLFEVTCGHTGKQFDIFADDQRSKHEWMLAIKKAIALAKVIDDYTKAQRESLSGKDKKASSGLDTDKPRADSTGEEHDPFSHSNEYVEMSVRDISLRESSEESGEEYMDMGPITEATMELLDNGTSVAVGDFTKPCTISHTVKDKMASRGVDTDKPWANSTGEEHDPFSPSDEYVEMIVRDNSSRESSEVDDDGYMDMGPITEATTMHNDMSVAMGDFTKSSHTSTVKAKDHKLKATRSNEDFPPENLYADADFKPLYTVRTDAQLGGYIDVKKAGGQHKRSLRSPMREGEEEKVGLMSSRSVALEVLTEEKRGEEETVPSPNNYLTIVRSTDPPPSNHGDRPPVPVHKRSSQLELTSHSLSQRPPTRPKRGLSMPLLDDPPAPHSRAVGHRSSVPATRDTTPTATSNHSNKNPTRTTPPPLPPR